MKIVEVKSKKTIKEFHKLPHTIYKNDKNWICPLEIMIEDTFTQSTESLATKRDIARWILVNDNQTIGRIAAFYDMHKAVTYEQPTGGCGFFECIDNQQAANLLFDTAKNWLQENGLEAMDGPINFGENYYFNGLLVDGFMPQGFGMPYNPKYYLSLFENYGFKTYFEQYSYHLDTTFPDLPERFWRIAERVVKNPQYSFEHLSLKNISKFAKDFVEIYNAAWQFHEHFSPVRDEDISGFLKSAKIFIDEEMFWFAYYKGKPIAFFAMIPDFNQILQHLNGKINFFSLLKIFWLKWRKTMKRTRAFVIGINPDFQRKGVETGIFYHLRRIMLQKSWYNEMELSWAGDFNPKIISLYESVGGKRMKTHYTMRYLFDYTKEFKRAPIIT